MSVRSLTIPGPPVPWSGKVTNRKTGNRFLPGRQAEATGRVLDAVERSGLDPFPAKRELSLVCHFFVKRPKGHYGTGRNEGVIKERYVGARPCGVPDLSNLVKLVEDGLVLAGLIPDDDQIVEIRAYKFYTVALEEQPRTMVEVEEWL